MSRLFSKLEEYSSELHSTEQVQPGGKLCTKSNSEDLADLFERGLLWSCEEDGEEKSWNRGNAQANNSTTRAEEFFSVPFEISDLDSLFKGSCGLPSGKIHEWTNRNFSAPPLTIPTILVCNALRETIRSSGHQTNFQRYIIWIGQECWPSSFLLEKTLIASFGHNIISQCLFLKTKNQEETFTCIDNALKSPAVFCVFANLHKIPLVASRRFSLLIKNRPSLAFFFLPENHSDKPTAAFSRWLVAPSSLGASLRGSLTETCLEKQLLSYKLTLLRTKGAKPNQTEWFIEVQDESKSNSSLSLALSSQLVNRAKEKEFAPGRKKLTTIINHQYSRAGIYKESVA